MTSRSTWVLLALALLLGGYVWWVEIRGKERQAEADAVARRVISLDVAALTALDLQTADGREARLQRDAEGDWRMVDPVDWAVDDFTVQRLVDALAELASTSTIDPAPDGLTQFGLGADARRLQVHAGDASLEIALGKRAPVGAARYVQVSTRPAEILVVSFADTSALEPDLIDLRDRRVASARPADVSAMVVRLTGGPTIRVERAVAGSGEEDAGEGGSGAAGGGEGAAEGDEAAHGAWHLTEPLRARADGERIERLIDELDLARASDFVDAPAALADYGLDPPLAVIELELARSRDDAAATAGDIADVGPAGPAGPLRIELGRTEDAAWVRRPGLPAVLQVRERLVDGLPREVFEYRHKRVLTLEGDAVTGIELVFPRDGAAYRFVRQDDRWRPEDDTLQVDSLEVVDLLFAIEELDAIAAEAAGTPLPDLGLDPPRVRVTARDAAGAELGWLELGDPHPDRGLAARSSASEVLWRVRNEVGEDVPLSLDAFRNDFADLPADDSDR